MPILGERTYSGDVADYGVKVVKDHGTMVTVTIVQHDSSDCTIPIGATITVPIGRII